MNTICRDPQDPGDFTVYSRNKETKSEGERGQPCLIDEVSHCQSPSRKDRSFLKVCSAVADKRVKDRLVRGLNLAEVKGGGGVSALKASFLVADRIAKAKKPFTIGEELILPAAKDICRELFGDAAAQKIAQIPLSATTVTRRIDEISEDIEAQLIERISASPWYAIQVDESTDVDNRAVMLVFVRYVFQEDVHEDMLCALLLPTNTTASEIFSALNDYMSGKLDWSFCVGVCTDGARAMTGRLSGFTTRVKEVAPECESTHCVIHREMLASKNCLPN
ncbi:hypothetical protein WMY93_020395 [Mugilogobius chulae]|uniref:Transposase n=1 Tax=Mugilogobius chulae TaxID=88201 RepID=A0AAW0NLW1_9GOBI